MKFCKCQLSPSVLEYTDQITLKCRVVIIVGTIVEDITKSENKMGLKWGFLHKLTDLFLKSDIKMLVDCSFCLFWF